MPPIAILIPISQACMTDIIHNSSQLPVCGINPKSPLYPVCTASALLFVTILPAPITALLVVSILIKLVKDLIKDRVCLLRIIR